MLLFSLLPISISTADRNAVFKTLTVYIRNALIFQNKIQVDLLPFWERFIIFALKKVRVVAKSTLREFWMIHKDCEDQLKSWFNEAEKAIWTSPNDIKIDYPAASLLQDNRVVFNIKGNNYRLIVKINYKYRLVWIRFIGTHSEYDKINAQTI